MATSGANLAVTKDGGAYNKLRRPDDYLMGTTAPLPPPLPAARGPEKSSKRKWEQEVTPDVKRPRPENKKYGEDTGMRTMLPSFEDEGQSSDESTKEALAYLRSVRYEASAIPGTLVAPKSRNVNDDDASPQTHDSAAHGPGFKDGVFGVWLSADEVDKAEYDEEEWDDDQEVQETCYAQLLKRFQALRVKILQSTNTSEHSHIPPLPISRRAWLEMIDRDTPKLEQIRHMDEHEVYFGIQSCTSSLAQSDKISREKSCWIWSLLAVAGDVGTLNNEHVGKIRDLGLQANRLRVRLQTRPNGSQVDESGETEVLASGSKDGGSGTKEWDNASVESGELVEEDEQEQESEVVYGNHPVAPETIDDPQAVDGNGDASSSDAEMSMSENEDEAQQEKEKKELEEARARLLAQLGDRLVQTQVPEVPASRAEAEWLRQQKQKQEEVNVRVSNGTSQTRTEETVSRGAETGSRDPTEAEWNTRITIDMILTVVAECYGQRDLLEFRESW
ncbi:hypothetical protein IQ07DRAFT_675140 [Pyrenochaeta sp. DS3sAY3a]|nr:hypothetical protein IQ07DRAFT_675140 [Pyrenochaeta sp. DS3sAY3a]